jgi:hypothetical protein
LSFPVLHLTLAVDQVEQLIDEVERNRLIDPACRVRTTAE